MAEWAGPQQPQESDVLQTRRGLQWLTSGDLPTENSRYEDGVTYEKIIYVYKKVLGE